jgi:hypothetical protein
VGSNTIGERVKAKRRKVMELQSTFAWRPLGGWFQDIYIFFFILLFKNIFYFLKIFFNILIT